MEEVDFPFSLREAKEQRKELMRERKKVRANQSDLLEMDYKISLCGH